MEQKQSARTMKILSFSTVALGFTVVLYSWALFILLPGGMLIVASLPLWLLIVWGLSRAAYKRGWHLSVNAWQWWIFWPLVALLVTMAPAYAYWYGYYHANRLFNALGIHARMIEIDYQLLDRFGDIGTERGFGIRYEVLEPLAEAEAKIRQHFENRPDWYVAGPNPNALYPILISAHCMTPRYFGKISAQNFPIIETGVTLQASGRLGVGFIYEQPRSCTDVR